MHVCTYARMHTHACTNALITYARMHEIFAVSEITGRKYGYNMDIACLDPDV